MKKEEMISTNGIMYKIKSFFKNLFKKKEKAIYGVMTTVLDNMLKENNIHIPYFEAPVKESLDSELVKKFFNDLICEEDNENQDKMLNVNMICEVKVNNGYAYVNILDFESSVIEEVN